MADLTPQQKGGIARSDALSAGEKKMISRKASLGRWEKDTPRSTHEGEFLLGDMRVSAAVLPNRQRIITQATFLRALGRSRSPKAGTGVFSTVDGTPFFLQAEVLKPFISEELLMSTTPVFFIDKSGTKSVGYDARILPNVADVYLRYRDALAEQGKRVPAQYKAIVKTCDGLVRFLAQKGIVALVDQATGFTDQIEREVVSRLLDEWLTDELKPYAPTFPVSWFKEVCRVRGITFRPDMRLPRYFGKIVNDLVWDRLAPGVRQMLDQRTPVGTNGRRRTKKFQWLTDNHGKDALLLHIGRQENMLGDFGDKEWDAFYFKLNKRMPPYQPLPLLESITDEQGNIAGKEPPKLLTDGA
ncbi:MAG: P63C domain-containing protein [Gemmatimonadaceae bacterium]